MLRRKNIYTGLGQKSIKLSILFLSASNRTYLGTSVSTVQLYRDASLVLPRWQGSHLAQRFVWILPTVLSPSQHFLCFCFFLTTLNDGELPGEFDSSHV